MSGVRKAYDGETLPPNWMWTGRTRGIVWVCRLEGSTDALADPHTAAAAEEFLKRLHWSSQGVVSSFAGRYIKWSGDGFLALFPADDEAGLRQAARSAIAAARHLSLLVDATQVGVKAGHGRFKVRHGITHEKDALAMHYGEPALLFDLLGRDVALAFRLSGVPAPFPGICTTDEVVEEWGMPKTGPVAFERRTFTKDEALMFFGGGKAQASRVVVSKDLRKARERGPLQRPAAQARSTTKAQAPVWDDQVHAWAVFLVAGPQWARDAYRSYGHVLQKELAPSAAPLNASLVT
ncbi:MAG TPA: hypothetical protein VM327_05335 [Candidatus Thermoplasmatota archaeon]|nr:hypothetical protein [Candidatus Thermoplasmatota archaeon]